MAYFSKQLDSVATGGPGCLQAVEATTLLMEEVTNLTLGQPLKVQTQYQVQTVLEEKKKKQNREQRNNRTEREPRVEKEERTESVTAYVSPVG